MIICVGKLILRMDLTQITVLLAHHVRHLFVLKSLEQIQMFAAHMVIVLLQILVPAVVDMVDQIVNSFHVVEFFPM